MPVTQPFRRTCRPFLDGSFKPHYMDHSEYAVAPAQYIGAFLLIQRDLLELFNYVEPADTNLPCYSYRIHELHTRACIEVEANCKAILTENQYSKDSSKLIMGDYKKLHTTHHLPSYKVKLPLWHGSQAIRTPFSAWAGTGSLNWYQAYNQTKHDRYEQFKKANFGNLLDAVAGLVTLLAAQFNDKEFVYERYTGPSAQDKNFEVARGDYFLIRYPDDWTVDEQYDFDWQVLVATPNPFQLLKF